MRARASWSRGELLCEAFGDLGEEAADKPPALGGEIDLDEAAVGGIAGAGNEAVALEVVHDQGEVAAAFQELGGELRLEERPEVIEGLERGELGQREVGGQDEVGAARDGVGRAHELDVSIEGEDLGLRTLMMGAHGSAGEGKDRDAGVGRGLPGVDFVDAGDVAAAFERGREPDLYDVQGLGLGDGALAEGETVGVVVGAVPDGDRFVPAEAAADAFDAVGDDGFAVAGAAEDDAAFHFAAGDGLGDGADEVGVVTARLGVGAEIADGVAGGEEHGFDGFLVGEAGVVGTDGDGKQRGHVGRKGRVGGRETLAVGAGRYSVHGDRQQTKFPP